VDVIQGRYRFRRRPKIHYAQLAARVFFFLAAPIALFGSAYLVSSLTVSWLENRRVVQTMRVEEARAAAQETEVEAERAEREFAAALAVAERLERHRLGLSRDSSDAVPALTTPEPIDPAILPLFIRKVILDPGHGGENLGTEAGPGLVEKSLVLDISQRLNELLHQASYNVEMTRTGDQALSLEERAAFANDAGGDIFVSIHLNWIAKRQVRGVETYYLGPTDDPYVKELAARENRESGFSMADFRQILERVYADVRQGESQQLAAQVQQALFERLRQVNPQVQDRGVKRAPFGVLTRTEMPAILAEVSCLSNEKEARLLMSTGYRQYIAQALFDGIERYARSLGEINQTGSSNHDSKG
jgi:N-acetylmuramoyl-L-alanine amidase